jgi:hypothetical protein
MATWCNRNFSVQDNSINESENTVPVGSKDEAKLWQTKNSLHK